LSYPFLFQLTKFDKDKCPNENDMPGKYLTFTIKKRTGLYYIAKLKVIVVRAQVRTDNRNRNIMAFWGQIKIRLVLEFSSEFFFQRPHRNFNEI